jgi:lipopolysaccharide cholinephosphotransferase
MDRESTVRDARGAAVEMPGSFDLTEVHRANLRMLRALDRICRKYRIHYVLDSGTLLGAVRHHGFIPWDDDVDVAMTRPDFEAFSKVAKRELPEGISFLKPEDIRGGKVFYDFIPRLIYDDSRRAPDSSLEQYYDGKLNHLWIDIMIIDRIPDGKAGDALARFTQKVIYGLAMGHRKEINYAGYSPKDRIRVKALTAIGRRISMPWLFCLQRKTASASRRKKTKHLWYTNYSPDWMYVTLESRWLSKIVDLPFEDTKLMCPAAYDEILRQLYGDYMKFPPLEERVPGHADFHFGVSHKDDEV